MTLIALNSRVFYSIQGLWWYYFCSCFFFISVICNKDKLLKITAILITICTSKEYSIDKKQCKGRGKCNGKKKLSGTSSNAWKDERKEKRRMISSKVDGLNYSGKSALLRNLKKQVRNKSSWRSIYVVIRSQKWFDIHNQKTKKELIQEGFLRKMKS